MQNYILMIFAMRSPAILSLSSLLFKGEISCFLHLCINFTLKHYIVLLKPKTIII